MASADLGDVLASFTPAPAGNGRAVAHDPLSGHLFFTNSGDPHIYVVTTTNVPVGTISPVDAAGNGINYGALAWDAKRGVLWGGRYVPNAGVPGGVDTIPATTIGMVTVTPWFAYSFPAGESCYGLAPGFIDGLAYDEGDMPMDADDSLWLSDDAATVLHHVDLTGGDIGTFAVPPERCNTGIAVDGQFFWLALQSGPDQAPHDIVRVAKSDPTAVLSSFSFGTSNIPGPEDLELDVTTFAPGHCAVWSNQFGSATTLTAWEMEQGIKPECPAAARLDIKPGSFPNSIKLSNQGVIPVALLGGASFDVTAVDYGTVAFAGDDTEAHATVHFGDVNGDGFTDAVLHYETQQTNIQFGDTQACDSVSTLDP